MERMLGALMGSWVGGGDRNGPPARWQRRLLAAAQTAQRAMGTACTVWTGHTGTSTPQTLALLAWRFFFGGWHNGAAHIFILVWDWHTAPALNLEPGLAGGWHLPWSATASARGGHTPL